MFFGSTCSRLIIKIFDCRGYQIPLYSLHKGPIVLCEFGPGWLQSNCACYIAIIHTSSIEGLVSVIPFPGYRCAPPPPLHVLLIQSSSHWSPTVMWLAHVDRPICNSGIYTTLRCSPQQFAGNTEVQLEVNLHTTCKPLGSHLDLDFHMAY